MSKSEGGIPMRALTLALVLIAVAVSAAAASPLAKPSLKLSQNPVKAGHALTVNGSADGFPGRGTVFVISRAFPATHKFAGVPALLTKVRAGGSFHTSTTIPSGRAAGVYAATA